MTAIKRIFIDKDDFYQFNTTPTNCNTIIFKAFPFMKSHIGEILGLQELSITGVPIVEVPYSTYDTLGNAGKYTVNPTTNILMLLVDKLQIDTEEKARAYAVGILMNYELAQIAYSGADNYVMEVRTAEGCFVGQTVNVKMVDINTKIIAYDSGIDVNAEPGFYIYTLRRSLVPIV